MSRPSWHGSSPQNLGGSFHHLSKGQSEVVIAQTSFLATECDQVEQCTFVLSQYEQRMRILELTVQLLIARTSAGQYWSEGLKDAEELLTALPIQSAEFECIYRHLENAIGYC